MGSFHIKNIIINTLFTSYFHSSLHFLKICFNFHPPDALLLVAITFPSHYQSSFFISIHLLKHFDSMQSFTLTSKNVLPNSSQNDCPNYLPPAPWKLPHLKLETCDMVRYFTLDNLLSDIFH